MTSRFATLILCSICLLFLIKSSPAEPPEISKAQFAFEVEVSAAKQKHLRRLNQIAKSLRGRGLKGAAKEAEAEAIRFKSTLPRSAWPKPTTDAELTSYLRGTKWQFKDDWVVTLNASGHISKSWGKLRPKWTARLSQIEFDGKTYALNKSLDQLTRTAGTTDLGRTGTLVDESEKTLPTPPIDASAWKWGSGGQLVFRPDGQVSHSQWRAAAPWRRIDRDLVRIDQTGRVFIVHFLSDRKAKVTLLNDGSSTYLTR